MTAMAKRPEPFTHTPTFSVHDGMKIVVVHTNDLKEVAKNLDMYEKMLEGRQPDDEFMGLDLEYTSGSEQRVRTVSRRRSTMLG